jgi:hypothetical protein
MSTPYRETTAPPCDTKSPSLWWRWSLAAAALTVVWTLLLVVPLGAFTGILFAVAMIGGVFLIFVPDAPGAIRGWGGLLIILSCMIGWAMALVSNDVFSLTLLHVLGACSIK